MSILHPLVIPVRPQAETGIHTHRTTWKKVTKFALLAQGFAKMNPGLAANAAGRDNEAGG